MRLVRLAPFALAAVLAACATGGGLRPAQVTRFHLGQPIAAGDIAVEPRPGGDGAGPEFRTYAGIVGAELVKLGFRQNPAVAASEQVAVVDVQRGSREDLTPRGGGLTLGLGGGGGGFRSGVGGGASVGIPLGGRRSNEVIGTMLSVQIKRRSDGSVIWEGRAMGEARAGSPEADPDQAVRRLAAALFQGFPGESGRTVEVK